MAQSSGSKTVRSRNAETAADAGAPGGPPAVKPGSPRGKSAAGAGSAARPTAGDADPRPAAGAGPDASAPSSGDPRSSAAVHAPFVAIDSTSIDVAALERCVAGTANGAVCSFIGQVRDNARGRQVSYLEYNAYVPMALKQMARIAAEAETRWDCQVAIQHRIGRLELGEASVAIAVGSPHRAEAFEACRWCIDTLKETVPIWKREVCPDGAFWIEGEDALGVAP